MATKQATVDYILEKIAGAGITSGKKMFGEYGLYCDGKVVALVCDDQLFIKPTQAGKDFWGEYEEGQPYPGAKPWILIPEDDWDDGLRLAELVRRTAAELPLPAPKKPRQPKKQ